MSNSKWESGIDLLILSAFSYLYIPVIIFCVTWFKWFIGIPVSVFAAAPVIVLILKTGKRGRLSGAENIIFSVIAFLLCLCWCYFSGLGGFVLQSGDFPKHNVILRDLITMDIPVRYVFNGKKGFLSYYIGAYLVPAFVGRAFGGSFDRANDALLLWTALGIFIALLLIYRESGLRKGRALVIMLAAIVLFATFVCPLSAIFSRWRPEEVGDGLHWLSNTIWIQYSSDITLLSYVFPQMLSGLLGVALFKAFRHEYDKWGLVLAPLVLYSAFVFLGMAVLMLTVLVSDLYVQEQLSLKSIFSLYNICSLITAAALVLYLLGNIIQERPPGIPGAFGITDYRGHFFTLLIFDAAWALWFVILYAGDDKKRDNALLAAAAINLFIYPFLRMGYYNDLCMRASIPALLTVAVTTAESLAGAMAGERQMRK
ncbi:MAG TPA: hypothetical protein DCL38_05120, partial [Lachnospiraceae bacterium]|nr:hypothetical protein [Lachnospiraceae bacterium]